MLIVGWLVGRFVAPTLPAGVTDAPADVVVTAIAEMRGPTIAPMQIDVNPASVTLVAEVPSGSAAAVVTAAPLKAGDTMASGALVAAVSGSPYFAITPEFPLFRDLGLGMSGPDVRSLNMALHEAGLLTGEPADTYSDATRGAIASMYARAGYVAEGQTAGDRVRFAAFVQVPKAGATVTLAAVLGAVLEPGTPVVTAEGAVDIVTARCDTVTAESLVAGIRANLTLVGGSDVISGEVVGVSDFRADGDPFPGNDVTVRLDEALAPGGPATGLLELLPELPEEPAVPLTAVRSDGSDYVVWVQKGEEYVSTPITITTQTAGWALLGTASPIQPGDIVRVSP